MTAVYDQDGPGLRHHARHLERRNDLEQLQALVDRHHDLGREIALKWVKAGAAVQAWVDGAPSPVFDRQGLYVDVWTVRGLRVRPLVICPRLAKWACDCAEDVLPLFERRHRRDDRPRRALEAIRAGEADYLERAVRSAAAAATYTAVRATEVASPDYYSAPAYDNAESDSRAARAAQAALYATYANVLVHTHAGHRSDPAAYVSVAVHYAYLASEDNVAAREKYTRWLALLLLEGDV